MHCKCGMQATVRKVTQEWVVDGSTFEGRKREVEARDVFDTERVRNAQFQVDWQRVATKSRFRRMVSRMDQVRACCDGEHPLSGGPNDERLIADGAARAAVEG
jgi:hypothetical protein